MEKNYDLELDEGYKGFYEWNKQVCFLDKEDERYIEYKKYKEENGISPDQTWSLFNNICIFMIPRLKEFKKRTICYPVGVTFQEWQKILDKMIEAFELSNSDLLSLNQKKRKKLQKKIEEGLDLFRKYFFDLWW